jgi:hypothetical protein
MDTIAAFMDGNGDPAATPAPSKPSILQRIRNIASSPNIKELARTTAVSATPATRTTRTIQPPMPHLQRQERLVHQRCPSLPKAPRLESSAPSTTYSRTSHGSSLGETEGRPRYPHTTSDDITSDQQSSLSYLDTSQGELSSPPLSLHNGSHLSTQPTVGTCSQKVSRPPSLSISAPKTAVIPHTVTNARPDTTSQTDPKSPASLFSTHSGGETTTTITGPSGHRSFSWNSRVQRFLDRLSRESMSDSDELEPGLTCRGNFELDLSKYEGYQSRQRAIVVTRDITVASGSAEPNLSHAAVEQEETVISHVQNGERITSDKYKLSTDQNDESLQRYKASLGLGGGGNDLSDPSDPRVCIIKSLTMESPGRGPVTIDLSAPGSEATLKDKPFKIKEGSKFTMVVTFKVQHEILSGLQYVQVVKRKGIKVGKDSEMLVCEITGNLSKITFSCLTSHREATHQTPTRSLCTQSAVSTMTSWTFLQLLTNSRC